MSYLPPLELITTTEPLETLTRRPIIPEFVDEDRRDAIRFTYRTFNPVADYIWGFWMHLPLSYNPYQISAFTEIVDFSTILQWVLDQYTAEMIWYGKEQVLYCSTPFLDYSEIEDVVESVVSQHIARPDFIPMNSSEGVMDFIKSAYWDLYTLMKVEIYTKYPRSLEWQNGYRFVVDRHVNGMVLITIHPRMSLNLQQYAP